MIKVMIIGQKWLAEQLLKQCLANKYVKVVAVSAPNLNDRLFTLASQHDIAATVHGKTLKQSQIPIGVDVILTAHAYCFVTSSARDKAKYGAVGYHPSLLPKYKGKTAIVDAISAGEQVTGGSLYQLDDDWDSGKVISQRSVTIDDGVTAETLWRDKLAKVGLELFDEYLTSLLMTVRAP